MKEKCHLYWKIILNMFFIVIDGSDFPLHVPSEGKSTRLRYYCGRPKDRIESRYNIKYIFGVHVATGKIVFVGPPTEGSRHDITALRRSGLLAIVNDSDITEIILADKGFVGEDSVITPYKGAAEELTTGQKLFNKILSSIRQIVECTLHRLKIFGILGSRGKWRWNRELHPTIVNLCAQITNISITRNPVAVSKCLC